MASTLPKLQPTFSPLRIRSLTDYPVRSDGEFVLYWMTAYRRLNSNFALQRAVDWASELKRPLLVLEAVRVGYRWASDRMHRFLIDGMIHNEQSFRKTPAHYFPYLETKHGEGSGLIEALARRACVLVSDDFPCFFHPYLYERIGKKLPVYFELIDGNGFLPMRAHDRTFTVAHSYRRAMQKLAFDYLGDFPRSNPFEWKRLPSTEINLASICGRWQPTKLALYSDRRVPLKGFAIDHSVPATGLVGGTGEGIARWKSFLDGKLDQYGEGRNEPDQSGSTGLSPYLHFGHVGVHQLLQHLFQSSGWSPNEIAKPNGKVHGFWNLGESVEALLDQLLTWRELGFNMCSREPNYDRYESLPTWAIATLDKHAHDPRTWTYSLDELEQSKTHDELWNAAQRQLFRDGVIHNYLRMLWGKKILEWSESPRDALKIMIELNNKYALDGRNPNSYTGIFWTLGRYDRPWGPERPIFGLVRYMSSDSTRRKFSVRQYLRRFGSKNVE